MSFRSHRFCVIVLLFSLVMISACSDPPIDSTVITDANYYGQFNEYVEKAIKSDFKGALPSKLPEDANVTAYYYEYYCASLGDPNFCINLKIDANSTDLYFDEKERLGLMSSYILTDSVGKEYYLVNANMDDIEYYMDSEILDGLWYCFECVVFDDSSNSIEYLSALLWDSAEKIECVENILISIRNCSN